MYKHYAIHNIKKGVSLRDPFSFTGICGYGTPNLFIPYI